MGLKIADLKKTEKRACKENMAGYDRPAYKMVRGRSSGVEHNLAKVRVVSSNLIARSIFFLDLKDLFRIRIVHPDAHGNCPPCELDRPNRAHIIM